jgi:predicted RNA-binding Zn-ribbon protein involved in translation (DUF1610 family)
VCCSSESAKSATESCPECGSEEFDELAADDATSRRLANVVVYVCRDCGTAWDAEKPRR